MKLTQWIASALAMATMVSALVMVPSTAQAQSSAEKRRQEKKNEWRNLAIASGALGVIGFIKNDKTLGFLGAAGALYSLDRYEKDRKSQNRIQRQRAQIFQRGYFVRDGKRYKRRTVVKNGKRYYQFVRA
jgi:flagellar biosynthesis component FlhA